MKKRILTIAVMTLACAVSACSYRGASFAEGTSEMPLHVAIELAAMRYPTDDPVPVMFYYGQDADSDEDTLDLLGHTVEVFLTADLGGAIDSNERVVLWERRFEGDAFLTEENRCDPGLPIFGRVSYQRSFRLEIDFSELDFTRGLIVIRIAETRLLSTDVGGERLERVVTVRRAAFFFFEVEDDTVIFSTRRIA